MGLENQLKNSYIRNTMKIYILPFRDYVVHPGLTVPVYVDNPASVACIEAAAAAGQKVVIAPQHSWSYPVTADDLYDVGTLGDIAQVLRMPDGTLHTIIRTTDVVNLTDVTMEKGLFMADVTPLEFVDDSGLNQTIALRDKVAENMRPCGIRERADDEGGDQRDGQCDEIHGEGGQEFAPDDRRHAHGRGDQGLIRLVFAILTERFHRQCGQEQHAPGEHDAVHLADVIGGACHDDLEIIHAEQEQDNSHEHIRDRGIIIGTQLTSPDRCHASSPPSFTSELSDGITAGC